MLPKEENGKKEISLRRGSAVARAGEAILKAGTPLHINDILVAIGKDLDRKSRLAWAGSLAAYVRDQRVFTRPEPNTFFLIELEDQTQMNNSLAVDNSTEAKIGSEGESQPSGGETAT